MSFLRRIGRNLRLLRDRSKESGESRGPEAVGGGDEADPLRFLGYALPQAPKDTDSRVVACEGFELHDEPLRSPVSFLDYDGVATFAGAFEEYRHGYPPEITCIARADLDHREREFCTALAQEKAFVFLIPRLPDWIGSFKVHSSCDLFRRVAVDLGIHWTSREEPFPVVESLVPEFREFVSRYGTAYVTFELRSGHKDWIRRLCAGSRDVFGLVIRGKVFFLPCTIPQNHKQAVDMANSAVEAAIRYRRRMSAALPEWVADFCFSEESSLRTQATNVRKQLVELEGEIAAYWAYKGALSHQSDPLVEVVRTLLDRFFGLCLTIDDKCIEDATLKNNDGEIVAVFEMKGVKGNFTRGNVNQLDSHRERLGLTADTPGVLIMNTIMAANSLQEKDQPPHPDIIKKAVTDCVILIRALDLLRYADSIEKGVLTKETFRETILTEAGWLKVEDDTAQVVKQ